MTKHHCTLILLCMSMMGAATMFRAYAQGRPGNPLDTLPVPAPTELRPGGGVASPVAAPPEPMEQLRGVKLTPLRFDIEGVQSVPFGEVSARFAPLVNREITVGQLIDVAGEVTQIYQDRGYALSFGYVPAQNFQDGVVRIVVVEGHVADVRIDGDAGRAEPKIREMAARILEDKPLRRVTFERYVGLLSQLPGLRLQASAPLPTATDGATVLTLKVVRQPVTVSAGVDAQKSMPRVLLSGVLNDPVFAGSQLSVSAIASSLAGEAYQSAQYTQFVGSDGLNLKLEASHYQGDPNAQLDTASATQRRATNDRVELSASYPLVLNNTQSLVVSGGAYGVNYTDQYSNPATGGALIYDTRVRAVFGQLSYTLTRPHVVRRLNLMLARGFDGAGALASASTNVPGLVATNTAQINFHKLLLQASQADSWPGGWGSVVSVMAQYSPDVLPTTERVSFGGLRFARGYAPGEASGDSGWGLAAELNHGFGVDMAYLKQVQPYVLMESARVYNHSGMLYPSRLLSVALGSRFSDQRYYSVDLSIAKPVGDEPIENPKRKPRLNATLSYRLGL